MNNADTTELIATIRQQASESQKFRIAIYGCLVAARRGLENIDEAKATLEFIEEISEEALHGE